MTVLAGHYRIRGGRVIDPANGIDRVADVWILDGRIAAIGDRAELPAKGGAEEIDASGCVVTPGFVDMHVHLREPGQESKETIASGQRAAIAGGFTSIACMANTVPVNDSAIVTGWIAKRAAESGVPVRVHPVGAVTKGLLGLELAELRGMRKAGAVAFSDDGLPVLSAGLYRRAMELARELDAPVISHCEDPTLTAGGAMHEGEVATELGLPGVPWASEATMVARDVVLAQATGARLHIAHVSTAESVRLLRDAKMRGIHVTGEASPHHLTLDHEAVRGWRTDVKMSPPLREPNDVDALVGALADGTIDAVATDHAPHGSIDKDCEFGRAANGVTGLETALPLLLSLVHAERITLPRAVELLTVGPARALGLTVGTLNVGALADVTVFDPEARWVYERPVSKSRNSPWLGQEMTGKVLEAFVGGVRCGPSEIVAAERGAAKKRGKRSA